MRTMPRRKSPVPPRTVSANPLALAFAANLEAWRLRHRLTYGQMARKLGVSLATAWMWCHSDRFPSVDHLWHLSQAMRVPAWKLIRDASPVGSDTPA